MNDNTNDNDEASKIGAPLRPARGECPLCKQVVAGAFYELAKSGGAPGEVFLPARGSGHLVTCPNALDWRAAKDKAEKEARALRSLQGVELNDGLRIELGPVEGLEDLMPPDLLDELRGAGLATGYALTLSGGTVESRIGDSVPLVLVLTGAQLEEVAEVFREMASAWREREYERERQARAAELGGKS